MIWCVEDDASIRDIELYALKSVGLEARGFANGEDFWQAAKNECPDLIVLDIMLPGVGGVELLDGIRNTLSLKNVPVIMATAKDTEFDKVQSLELGADYYITKPFGVMEFVSIVKAVMRRSGKEKSEDIHIRDLHINCVEHIVKIGDKKIELTYKEFEMLKLFALHPKVAFSRERLMKEVWGTDFYGETRTVDMHIKTLRQKLEDYGELIKTVRNIGYRLEDFDD